MSLEFVELLLLFIVDILKSIELSLLFLEITRFLLLYIVNTLESVESSLSFLGSAGPSSPYTANTLNPQIAGEPYHDFGDFPPLTPSQEHFLTPRFLDLHQDLNLTCAMAHDEFPKKTGNDDLIPAP